MAQINTVLIPALVIQQNNTVFRQENIITGKVLDIPCREAFLDDTDYWAVPVKDEGVFTGLSYVLAAGENIAPPTFDSFKVTRVRDKLSKFDWWVYGTHTDLINSCATCCDSPPVPMPGIDGIQIIIAPCQFICTTNDNGEFYAIFGLPTLEAGEAYYPVGSYENVAFATASPTGYATVELLLAFLNSSWNPGSPPSATWTASEDGLTLIATGLEEETSLCVIVEVITP
jgi:hypothetical protein